MIKLRQQTYRKYKSIKKARCPYLKKQVVFNSKGFWHIIYRSRNKKRDNKSQILRFKLFNKAVFVVKTTATLQEYQEIKKRVPKKRKWRKIRYFGFIAIVDGWKIKVIVKQDGNGQPYFWSIIPNWITTRKRDRLLHKGNLEKD